MKVIQVLDSLEGGGAQQVVVGLTRWLLGKGVEGLVHARDGALRAGLDPKIRFAPKRDGSFASELLGLARLCQRERPDVLHAHQRREALACNIVGAGLGIAVVEHAHSLVPALGHEWFSFRSPRIFAVSPQVAELVAGHFGRDPQRVLIVPNALPRGGSTPPLPRRPPAGRPLRILGIGRLVEAKDPARFVRVIAALGDAMPVEARWLGEGEMRARVEDEATRLGAPVTFAGFTLDVASELDAADGLLVTSRHEGDPLVALEAFARMRPVVATAVGGLRSLVADGRGTLVDPACSDHEFAKAVARGVAFDEAIAAQTERAHVYVAQERSEESAYMPVLRTYGLLARGG